MDSTENRSEILGKFENVVLEKDREDRLGWLCKKRSFKMS